VKKTTCNVYKFTREEIAEALGITEDVDSLVIAYEGRYIEITTKVS